MPLIHPTGTVSDPELEAHLVPQVSDGITKYFSVSRSELMSATRLPTTQRQTALQSSHKSISQIIYLNPLWPLAEPGGISSSWSSLKILSSFLFSLQSEKLSPAETTATSRQNAVETQDPFT